MDDRELHLETLLDLETRHEELLSRLEDLDQRVERVLAECLALREVSAPGA